MAGRKTDTWAIIAPLIPIYGITLIDVFGYMIMIPLLPYLAQKYGASGVEVGALPATMAVASTVATGPRSSVPLRLGRSTARSTARADPKPRLVGTWLE